MTKKKSFPVFGENVDVLVASEETSGAFSMVVQTSPPGGGPPPHVHRDEDEIFRVLEGEFEMFDGERWTKLKQGKSVYALRGSVHAFRNCGTTDGKMEVVILPGKMDRYLEELSAFSMPDDAAEVMALSARYGIRFVGGEAPAEAAL